MCCRRESVRPSICPCVYYKPDCITVSRRKQRHAIAQGLKVIHLLQASSNGIFSYSCAAFDTMSTDIARNAVHLRYLSFLLVGALWRVFFTFCSKLRKIGDILLIFCYEFVTSSLSCQVLCCVLCGAFEFKFVLKWRPFILNNDYTKRL